MEDEEPTRSRSLSLRGAQRRGNPQRPRVIARSAATRQSPSYPVSRRGLLRLPGGRIAMTHLFGGRGAHAEPFPVIARSAATKQSPSYPVSRGGLLRLPGGRLTMTPCACRVIARSAATKQSPSLSCACLSAHREVRPLYVMVLFRERARPLPYSRWSPSPHTDATSLLVSLASAASTPGDGGAAPPRGPSPPASPREC